MVKKCFAKILEIKYIDSLYCIRLDMDGYILTMISLDISFAIQAKQLVSLNIKPTSIAIAKNLHGVLSCSNQLEAQIISIENGTLLSSIILRIGTIEFESIITLDSCKQMNLQLNDLVIVLVNANEIYIDEVE